MITEIPLNSQIQSDGFVFTLTAVCIRVDNLDGELVAYLPVLDNNGHRIVRTQEEFETEAAFWIKDIR